MSAGMETWIGAGALLGNMVLTVFTGRKTVREAKVVAQSTANDAAQAVKAAAQEQIETVRQTGRLAADHAATGAKDGALSALNGTAVKVDEIKRMLGDHIAGTTRRFDQQDTVIASVVRLEKSNATAIRALQRVPRKGSR